MNCKQKHICILSRAAFALICLLSAAAPAPAEPATAKPAVEKWRPKDGLYASPGAKFAYRCNESVEVAIDLAGKSIGDNETDCKITKLTDTGPGAIRLDLACTDINRETPEKEIILLKRIDDKAIFYRGTSKGKFRDRGGPISYCPDDVQRVYVEQKNKD